MSFKAKETSGNVKQSYCSDEDQASLSDDSSETSVTVEASVTPQCPLSETNSLQSSVSERCRDVFGAGDRTENVPGYDSRLISACVDENSVTVGDSVSELSVSGEAPGIMSQVISSENCAESSDVLDSADRAEGHMGSSKGKNTIQLQGVTETESVVDMHTSASFEACIEFNDDGGGDECSNGQSDNDRNSNLLTGTNVFAADVSSVGYDSCLADFTNADTAQDEYYNVQFNADVERTESRENPSELNTWRTKHKTVSAATSFVDRKSRPVPLPRSNTFRAKSTSEIESTRSSKSTSEIESARSSRCSIPVQYETCSSVQSKVCQTMALGAECESEYTLPPGLNFSGIYVDHRTIDEWTGENDYDLLRESMLQSADDDDYNRSTYCEPDVVLGRGLSTHESDYDVLRDDIWEDAYDGVADCPVQTENESGARVRSASDESHSCSAGARNDTRDVASFQSAAKPSLPVDVCVEEIVGSVVA